MKSVTKYPDRVGAPFRTVVVAVDGRQGGRDAAALAEKLLADDGSLIRARVAIPDSLVEPNRRAQVAVEVADDLHHLGLATLLMIRWAQFAEEHQIPRFFAEVLPENREMLAVFRDGFAAVSAAGRDEIDVEFPTSNWRAARARSEP